MMKLVVFLFLCIITFKISAQDIPVHIDNKYIYELLDELASDKIIEINSAIKPYSRKVIANKLLQASLQKNKLSQRQQQEISFYLKDYAKELTGLLGSDNYISRLSHSIKKKQSLNKRIDLFYYKDSLFTLTLNPIVGGVYYKNTNGGILHRYSGAEASATIGKNWAFYANIRDNNESERLINPTYLTQHAGASDKSIDNNIRAGIDWSEMRGGIVYSWKWGSISFVKDHFEWGTNNNGANIFSGHAPSFAMIKLNIKPVSWFDFNYVHGWLSSRIIDSTRIYHYSASNREVFISKYLTTNMLTVSPFKHLNFSFGNSVIYAEKEYPQFIIPLLFYKSVDHSYTMNNNMGTNAQMFFDISSRQIKHLHLYTSIYIDEIGISRMWVDTAQSNFVSMKFGASVSDLGLKNLTLISEYTKTNPLTYQHFLPITSFTSSDYNLGHYLRDNSQEVYLCLKYKPIRGLHFSVSYTHAKHGDDFVYGGDYGKYKNRGPWGLPYMENVTWESEILSAGVSWQALHDVYISLALQQSNTTGNVVKYTPPFLYGKQNTIIASFNIGF